MSTTTDRIASLMGLVKDNLSAARRMSAAPQPARFSGSMSVQGGPTDDTMPYLPVMYCGCCGALVFESYFSEHRDWHLRQTDTAELVGYVSELLTEIMNNPGDASEHLLLRVKQVQRELDEVR